MRIFKSIHLAVGIFGIVLFVLTGQYMAIFLKGLADMADGPRLLYRTSHLYLMWTSLLNLVVGLHYAQAATRNARTMQSIASVALLLGLPLILIGFAVEPRLQGLDRPFCGWANYLALGGTILYAFAGRNRVAVERDAIERD